MASKTILVITGGNTGLGFEIVRALLKGSHPYHVFLGSRSLDNASTAIEMAKKDAPNTSSQVTSFQLDLAEDSSISKAFEHVKSEVDHIDVLVNNGGANFDNRMNSGKIGVREGWNATWDVNVTGTHIMTNTFMPLLLKSSKPRLIFMTSGTSSLEEAAGGFPHTTAKPPAGWPKPFDPFSIIAYRSSKAGLNMLMLEWARILKKDNVRLWSVAPGFLATGLGGAGKEVLLKFGALEPEIGANFVKDIIEGKRDEDSEKVIRNIPGKLIQPW